MKIIGRNGTDDVINMSTFSEIPRFCYRNGFSPIDPGNYSSDKGWGCCYRSSQGVLAQYVIKLKTSFPDLFQSTFGDASPCDLFMDTPESPFGIHKMVFSTVKAGISVGEWAKPSAVAFGIQQILKDLNLSCIVSRDFTLLITGLFGLNSFDMSFLPFLQLCLCADGSLGFVSGHKNAAYYVIGFDSSHFTYFDPHVTKPAALSSNDAPSFYQLQYKLLNVSSINPSVLIGFMCLDHNSVEEILFKLMSCHYSPICVASFKETEDVEKVVLDIDDL